jgi:hypothetical protein
MRKKAIIRRLKNTSRTRQPKSAHCRKQDHPMVSLIKAGLLFIKGTSLIFATAKRIKDEEGPEAMEKYMADIEKSGILQKQSDTAAAIKNAADRLKKFMR